MQAASRKIEKLSRQKEEELHDNRIKGPPIEREPPVWIFDPDSENLHESPHTPPSLLTSPPFDSTFSSTPMLAVFASSMPDLGDAEHVNAGAPLEPPQENYIALCLDDDIEALFGMKHSKHFVGYVAKFGYVLLV